MTTTTTSKFTPGPWWYDYARDTGAGPGFTIFDPNTASVADVTADREAGVDGATVEANARLIAAAPELLDMVKAMLKSASYAIDSSIVADAEALVARVAGAVAVLAVVTVYADYAWDFMRRMA